MAKRDSLGCGPQYKAVRNRVTAMVRWDKEASNLAKLVESGNSPAVLWEIANAAVGKPRQPLPTCKHHQQILHAKSVEDLGWEGSPKYLPNDFYDLQGQR
jgi:hypothetical protein